MSNENTIRSLLSGTEFDDPRMYDLMNLMLADFYKVYYQLNPPVSGRAFGVTGSVATVATVSGIGITVNPTNVRLSWDRLDGAVSYEVRYQYGTSTDWDTASSLLTTSTLNADIDPITLPLIYGTHTFLIKATNSLGAVSATAGTASVVVSTINAPVITPTIIDNFVLLKWTIPSSQLLIHHYDVYKNGTLIGKMDGTFEAIFETIAGTFTYVVQAIDIAGNIGTAASISLSINQPPDYELQDDRISDLSGTISNCVVEGSHLVAIVVVC